MKRTAPPRLDPDVLLDPRAEDKIREFQWKLDEWIQPLLQELNSPEIEKAYEEIESETLQQLHRIRQDNTLPTPPYEESPPRLQDHLNLGGCKRAEQWELHDARDAFSQWFEHASDSIYEYGPELAWNDLFYRFSVELEKVDPRLFDDVDWDELAKALL